MNTWLVKLASQNDGAIREYPFSALWNPEKDYINDGFVGMAAAAQAWWETGKKVAYLPVTVELVAKPEEEILH